MVQIDHWESAFHLGFGIKQQTGIFHFQRGENELVQRLVELHARDFFDDQPQQFVIGIGIVKALARPEFGTKLLLAPSDGFQGCPKRVGLGNHLKFKRIAIYIESPLKQTKKTP